MEQWGNITINIVVTCSPVSILSGKDTETRMRDTI